MSRLAGPSTLTRPKSNGRRRDLQSLPGGGAGSGRRLRDGGRGDGRGHGGEEARGRERAAIIAVWIVLAASTMLFLGFTSTYLVRRGGPDWLAVDLPPLLWVNTALLVVSSVAMEGARRYGRAGNLAQARRYLRAAITLGLAFVGGQALAWGQLLSGGVGVAAGPHSSFFYLLTGVHGAHVLGGLGALLYGWSRLGAPAVSLRWSSVALTNLATYWHFVDGVWLYVFLLLLL